LVVAEEEVAAALEEHMDYTRDTDSVVVAVAVDSMDSQDKLKEVAAAAVDSKDS
jgi:hypothetical protein